MRRRMLLQGAAAVGLAPFAGRPAWAQAFPDRTITFVVPFAAGGGGDIVARMLAKSLSDRLGKQVAVENRVGASGNIGAAHVLRSPPNGYTLLNLSSTYGIQAALAKVPFDPVGDMQPIIMSTRDPVMVVVAAGSPFKSVADLTAAAKAAPGRYTHGSAGLGSIAHLAIEQLADTLKIDLLHVPYKGTSLAFTDLLGGRIDMMMATPIFAAGQIKAGKARAIGVCGDKRLALMPDVPTFAEQRIDYEVYDWKAIAGPKGIPADVVATLNRELNEVLKEKALIDKFTPEGTALVGGPPDVLINTVRGDIERWRALGAKINLKLE